LQNFFEKPLYVFFTPINSSHYFVQKNIEISYEKINSLRDILHFMSKCMNFVNSIISKNI